MDIKKRKPKDLVLLMFPFAISQKMILTEGGYGYAIVDKTTGKTLSGVRYTRAMAWKHASDMIADKLRKHDATA